MDIAKMARDNSEYLKNQYALLIMDNRTSPISNFAEKIRNEWKVSINMRPNILIRFFISGKYKNVHESRAEMITALEAACGINVPQGVADKARLKEWHNSRMLFENSIQNGIKFKYGALNIGGIGAERYGDFCVVFGRDYLKFSSTIVFIREDSLNYINGRGIDEGRLGKDIADANHVQYLATLKHKEDIITKGIENVHSMICNNEYYIESIIQDELLTSHIECVRIDKKRYLNYFSYLFTYLSSRLDGFEKYQLDEFWDIIQFLKGNKIEMEVVDVDAC